MDKLKMQTVNMTEKNIDKILELFPNVATESKDENGRLKTVIDFEKLKQELSENVIEKDEAFDFTWVGKNQAMVEANTAINKTLRPCKDESKDWDNTENIFIEGDNLEALKILRESYLGQVKMIYIDPPYNTGKDFVYRDNFKQTIAEYEEELGLEDEEGNKLFQNTETNGRFHSDWCSMIYPRLKVAKDLLAEDGVIFISIDDNEQSNLKQICDEVFGESNFVAVLSIETANGVFGVRASQAKKTFIKNKDYVIVYSKDKNEDREFQPLYMPTNERFDTHYSIILDEKLNRTSFVDYIKEDISLNYYFTKYNLSISLDNISTIMQLDKQFNKIIINELSNKIYQDVAFSLNIPKDIEEELNTGKIIKFKDYLISKTNNGTGSLRQYISLESSLKITDEYQPEYRRAVAIGDFWEGFDNDMKNVRKEIFNLPFETPKPIRLIKQMGKWINDKNSIILDFFAGSGTTAHAVMQLNAEDGGSRKCISIQLPEETDVKSEAYKAGYTKISDISKERIRRAGAKILEDNANSKDPKDLSKLDTGFRVFKVDSTNMKDVYYTPHDTTQSQIGLFESNIKDDRTDEDLLYQVLLDWGVELSLPHTIKEIDGKKLHIINTDDLVACFDEDITESVIYEIAQMQPSRVVFRDSCFAQSSAKINIEEIFKLKAPNTTVKVI